MRPSNDAHGRSGGERSTRPARGGVLLVGAAALALCAACGPDSASRRQDVRLDVSHEPPGWVVAGDPFLIGIRARSEPPLAEDSAHLWYLTEGDWVRLPLVPLAGTDRLEAELPPQPRGRVLRYYFTVESPLGETVRLPEAVAGARSAGGAAPAYELVARSPVAPWAAWLRAAGAAAALLLVVGGALLGLRGSATDGTGGRRTAATLTLLGVVLFALAALPGALAASYQATGDLLQEVPAPWGVALLLWLPLLALARPRRPGDPSAAPSPRSGRARPAVVLVLAVLGALAVVYGAGTLL